MAYILPNLSPTLLQPPKDRPLSTIAAPLSSHAPPPHTKLEPPPPHALAQVNRTTGANDNKQQHDHRNDFYVNLGLAVRTLREDMPSIFTKDLNYDIYRDDVTFIDPLNTFSGIEKYRLIFLALRFHGRILFREISLDVLRIWQPSENMILIRWNLRGIPRVPWEAKGEFQGTSRYKLDRNGKIYEHKVDNLAFNLPQTLRPAASVLDLVAASCPATPNPTFSYESCSWLEFYKAVRDTLDQEEVVIPQDCLIYGWYT
ncbi:hypothetical protein SASPL_130290 [Salvia splendens]|uniref:Uncharacterized protein n=1 Tax=Salvia splendens TaxID=180675 RepID=A0A8X8X5T7_SALSN|nr:uncharacterized protein LOC121756517 [Salvia splendens]KAG6407303.1 hypothetical protein SASPL_130290 [Salvia splendens]